ncbi:MAG: hypothetical protein KDA47_19080 [Planctomycetales bacterium]|nr:hypothetical protein [Planctomycetales bacterium]
MKRLARPFAGLVIWMALAGWLAAWLGGAHQRRVREFWLPQLTNFVAGERHDIPLRIVPGAAVANRDPVFVEAGENRFRQVGEVRWTGESSDAPTVLLYPDAPPVQRIEHLTAYRTPDSMQWVVETMLPPAKREQIIAAMTEAFEQHHEEIVNSLRPMVEASLRDALVVVEEELPAAIARHQSELEQIGGRYQRDLVEREIVPLVRKEIWPIVRREAEPAVTEISQEIWRKASLWRFGWRMAYDRSPLPQKNLLKQEWERFVEEDAAPVLEEHTDDLIRAQQRILAEVARNEEVRQVMQRSMKQIIADRELQGVVWQLMRELLIDNPRIHDVFDRHWRSPEAHAVYARIGRRLEPTVTRIGEIVIGTPESGITPEFARVLRNRVLNKEQRWLVVRTSELASVPQRQASRKNQPPRTLMVRPGGVPNSNPFVVETSPL